MADPVEDACNCLGVSDPAICKLFFQAMLDSMLKPYMPAIKLALALTSPDPDLVAKAPELALDIPLTAPDIFSWNPDLPPISFDIPGLGAIQMPGIDIPGWTPDMSLALASFFFGASMIPIKPVLDFATSLTPPELPTLEGITATLPLPDLPVLPKIECLAEFLMFPVTMLNEALSGGSGEDDDENTTNN